MNKNKINFKYEIGQTIQDEKRSLTILNRECRSKLKLNKKGTYTANEKWYLICCNKCKYTSWRLEGSLSESRACRKCFKQIYKRPIPGENSVFNKSPAITKYFKYPEEAKKYTCYSKEKITTKCLDCGREKDIKIDYLCRYGFKCACGDKKPYPEKLMINILEQLGLKFRTEYLPKWNNLGNKRYDFYIIYNNEEYIIETHGEQHYRQQGRKKARTLIDEQENDRFKKQIALNNGIKEENYIVINCLRSNIEWIKNNDEGLYKSNLNKMFNLDNIDWTIAETFALKSLVKTACEIKKNNPELTTTQIGKLINIGKQATTKYLKQGCKLGWCYYNSKEEYTKNVNRNATNVEIFKGDTSLGVFSSAGYIERKSEELFGVKLGRGTILERCNGKNKEYKGFTFKFK